MDNKNPTTIPHVRLITVSGRIASGSTTLAKKLARILGWNHMEGGEIFWEAVRNKLGLSPKDTGLRPDEEDRVFDDSLKQILATKKHLVVETKLAGFLAKNIADVFKILVVCNDNGEDQTSIRIDRLVNREHVSVEQAKEEVLERENSDVLKWQRLYAGNDQKWNYWKSSYYDFVVNSFSHDPDQVVSLVLEQLKIDPKILLLDK